MPPGGAEFVPVGLTHVGNAAEDGDTAEQRRALASLENARAEDIPDNYREPQYHQQPAATTDVPAEIDSQTQPQDHLSDEELERLGASLAVEIESGPGPNSPPTSTWSVA